MGQFLYNGLESEVLILSRVTTDKNNIYIDGKATKIMSGAMHYFRIHPAYWRDRLLKLKELGCNCVETYLAWNLHEKREGEFDFSEWLDFGKYLDTAKELGLFAIVRPGPYICSEMDLGGMPWWLLRYPGIALRTSDPLFLAKTTPFLKKACEILSPRTVDRGGNVILVQVENEYGSYSDDKEYLGYLRDLLVSEGIDCPLITSDGYAENLLRAGTLAGVMASVNYRSESERALSELRRYCPDQPGAVMELWNGRAQHWGSPLYSRNLDEVADSVKKALENAALVNLYMFHGGTTFGFMNGMVYENGKPAFQMTSYDVEAPLDEYGRRTEKYYREQAVIAETLGIPVQNTAKDTVLHTYGEAFPCGVAPLCAAQVSSHIRYPIPHSMEMCGEGYGYIVYETDVYLYELAAFVRFHDFRDVAHVYLDGVYQGSLWAEDEVREVPLYGCGKARLSILVENLGRCNFGAHLSEGKGIISYVECVFKENGYLHSCMMLSDFDIYTLPIDVLPTVYGDEAVLNAPAFYKYTFCAERVADTVLMPKGFTRGVAFINGFNLGRHWTIEHSDNRLYIPAPLLREGENMIVVFDVLANEKEKSVFLGEG